MGSETKPFVGWSIGEAIWRCADPDLVSRCFANHKSWKAAGRRTRFSFRNVQIEGREAAHHNDRQRVFKALLGQKKHIYRQLQSSLVKHLLTGALVAWGQRASPVKDPTCIPARSWKYLRINARKSIAIENTQAKTKLFGIRVFPVIESPDAIDRLSGKTFVEAFQMAVPNDPQLTMLRKRAFAVHAQPASLGYDWKPYRAIWPVGFGRGNTGAVGFLRKFDEPLKYNREQAANRVLAARFAKLMQFLSEGRLVAEGIPKDGGTSVLIPRSIWQRDRTFIDLENGDLVEIDPRAKDETTAPSRPTFTGLMLLKPAQNSEVRVVSENPATDGAIEQQAIPVQKSVERILSRADAEAACLRWLKDLMRSSPTKKPQPRAKYLKQALNKWPGILGGRAFERCWNTAIKETEGCTWSASGRPKSSHR
jgi:hypothetical protein